MTKTKGTSASANKKKILKVLTRLQSIQPDIRPTDNFLDNYTLIGKTRPGFKEEYEHVQQQLLEANPYRSFSRLAELLPSYASLFKVALEEVYIYHGYTERKAEKEVQKLFQSDSIQRPVLFLHEWFSRAHRNLEDSGLVNLIKRPPPGVIYKKEALVAVFDSFIYLKTLGEMIWANNTVAGLLKDVLTEYSHYNELVSLRNGEVREVQLPRATSYLTARMRKDLLQYFDLPIDQWNSLTTFDGKQFFDLQMDCLKNGAFSELALDNLFKDVMELVETPTNSKQSKRLALQPLFRLTHGVKSYKEWCVDQELAFSTDKAVSPDYVQYVKRKLEGIIGS